MVKKYVVVTALALVSTTGWAQEPQDSIESVDKYLNLKEVVIKGGLPHTRLKGNAMVTRVDGTALASSGSLGELLVKVPGMTGTDEAPEVLGKGTPLIYIRWHPTTASRAAPYSITSTSIWTSPRAMPMNTVSSSFRRKMPRRATPAIATRHR